MTKNKIKSDSTGIQAGGDITINQNPLSDAIEGMVVEILKPNIELVGNELKTTLVPAITMSIGQQIRDLIAKELSAQLKTEFNTKNIFDHVKNVNERLAESKGQGYKRGAFEDKVKQAEMFGEWIENIEKRSYRGGKSRRGEKENCQSIPILSEGS